METLGATLVRTMYETDIEEMHSNPGRFRVVYWNRPERKDIVIANVRKQIWKDDWTEQAAKQEEIVCYRTLNEL